MGRARLGKRTEFVVVALLVLLAAVIRARDLGRCCYAVDEFYSSSATSFILDKGIPEFPSGGYYVRGILPQYLAAVPALVSGQSEFTDRLFPLIFGVLTIPALYVFARNYLSPPVATLCAAALLLSSWHVEFSRFARMYSAFQFLFVLFVHAIYRGYWRHDRRWAVTAWCLAVVGIFVHEASAFLPCLLLVPLLRTSRLDLRRAARAVLGVLVLVALNYSVHAVDYRNLGLSATLPPDYAVAGGRSLPLDLPAFALLPLVPDRWETIVGYAVLLAVGAWLMATHLRRHQGAHDLAMQAGLLLLPLAHLYDVLGLGLLALAVPNPSRCRLLLRRLLSWLPFLLISGLYWVVVAMTSDAWHAGAPLLTRAMKTGVAMFSSIGVHSALVAPYGRMVPIYGLILLFGVVASTLRALLSSTRRGFRVPLAVTLLCILLLPLFHTPGDSTRYSFFLVPLLLCLLFVEAAAWTSGAARVFRSSAMRRLGYAAALLPALALAASEDFHPGHLLRPSDKEFNFRMGAYAPLRNHWYAREDFETPARFVNGQYRPGDIVVTDHVVCARYLECPFINYVPLTSPRFTRVSRKAGTEEIWTGRPLIYDPAALAALATSRSEARLWVIADAVPSFHTDLDVSSLAEDHDLRAELVYTGIDGRVGVWLLTRGRP